MKEITSILILLSSFGPLKAQMKLFGAYKYCTENSEKLAFNYVLDLNCNMTFKMFDSATNSTVIGTWNIKKEKELILSIDSTKLKSEISTKKRKWEYTIKNDRLYEKIMTEAQYRRESKNFNRAVAKQTGENSTMEDYDKFKATQENRYLLKIRDFSCSQ